MTMAEKLAVHEEIERKNREKVTRWKLAAIYSDFVRSGKYYEGRLILKLLRNGRVSLTLRDEDWNVETALIGVANMRYSWDGNWAYASI